MGAAAIVLGGNRGFIMQFAMTIKPVTRPADALTAVGKPCDLVSLLIIMGNTIPPMDPPAHCSGEKVVGSRLSTRILTGIC